MHKRRVSDDIIASSSSFNRKKLSSQFMDRNQNIKESIMPLSSTVKIDRKSLDINPIQPDDSIANIIQEKVANLKNKFGELDDLRKRLIESRCDVGEDQESRKNFFERSRVRANESNTEIANKDMHFTRQYFDKNLLANAEKEKKDIELYNERKCTQKIILQKNLIERESQEKEKQLQNQIEIMKLEIESINLKLASAQKDVKELGKTKKQQESVIESQISEIQSLESRLSSSTSLIKSLKNQIKKLDNKLKSHNENNTTKTTAIKNLSYIILSKDSPAREVSSNQQIINKYVETLYELQSSDKFLLSILRKLDNNNIQLAHKRLEQSKIDITTRIERSLKDLDDLERFVYECNSPTPSLNKTNFSLEKSKNKENENIHPCFNGTNFSLERTKTEENENIHPYLIENEPIDNNDFLSWIKCQALMVEDLLIISEIGGNNDVKML